MTRTAHILSNIGTAIITEGDQYFTVRLQAPDKLIPLTGYELSQFINSRSAYKQANYSNTAELAGILRNEYEKWEALDNALELMDASLSEDYRKGIQTLLREAVLANNELYHFIKAKLLTTVLPKGFFPDLALLQAEKEGSGAEVLVGLYENLDVKTDLWSKFYTLFSLSLHLEMEELDHLINVLTEEYKMHEFTEALYSRSRSKYDDAVEQCEEVMQRMHVKYDPSMFNSIADKLNELYKIDLPALPASHLERMQHFYEQLTGIAGELEHHSLELHEPSTSYPKTKATDILYVSAEPSHIAMLKGELGSKYSISSATSADGALAILKLVEVSVIISDPSLKNMSGIQLLSQLMEEFPDPMRILFTGPQHINDIIDAINNGVLYKFLAVPYTYSELATTIASAHDVYRLKKENKKLQDALMSASEKLNQLTQNKQTH